VVENDRLAGVEYWGFYQHQKHYLGLNLKFLKKIKMKRHYTSLAEKE